MTWKAILELCRIPNVFTAFANVAAGVVLARRGAFELEDVRLVLGSGLLYCSGMVLNDTFDRHVDADERPERPIPSGRVSPSAAAALGTVLMAVGVGLCAAASPSSRNIALALAAAILIYDGGAKRTALGPVAMGACRSLNVALGLSVSIDWTAWMWTAPVTMGLYTAVITYLARDEVVSSPGGSARVRLQAGVVLMAVLAASFALAFSAVAPARHLPGVLFALPFMAFVMIRGASLFRPLWSDPSGPMIGRAIGGGILLMPVIDATIVAGAGYPAAAVLVAGFCLPAIALERAFYVT